MKEIVKEEGGVTGEDGLKEEKGLKGEEGMKEGVRGGERLIEVR